ncbi:unnamed protein product [Fraxinus pennsylvanica]|uniref:Uncharacterized protein n=1 Tax=Fraxinus pennsylvanica TaxID=56036 RepID=A0AAD2DU79_9LAMI|nr:unnamed protein product [Fraxinus pennsylvanica]
MAKILQRWSSQEDRDQAGCVWGLISIFDFRHGRSTRKLLGDRRRVSKLAVGSSRLYTHPTSKCQDFEDGEESKMAEAQVVKTSVKELMKEEMFNSSKNQANEFEINLPQIDSEPHIKKNHKQGNRICRTLSCDMDVSELDTEKCLMPENFRKVPEQKPSDMFDMESLMDELSRIHQKSTSCMNHGLHNDLDMPSGLEFSTVEAKLVEAVKVFIEHRLSNGKGFGEEGKIHFSEEMMDALQTLSSNKPLFLKLLQDPNSVLVKHIQKLEDAQLEKVQILGSASVSNLSEEKQINSKSDDLVSVRHRKFFRRRRKSLESYPLEGNETCEASSKIVILKPGPAVFQNLHTDVDQSHYTIDNKVRDERGKSQFSFTEIRRKLRHAMGKERWGISPNGLILKFPSKRQNEKDSNKGSSGENVGWSSPNRNHFYTERFGKSSTGYKRSQHVGKTKDNFSVMANETSQNPRKGVPKIYNKEKKHLSEMLNNEDDNAEPVSRYLPKSLGRILSLPEYNSSPCCSSREYNDDTIIAVHKRLSPRGMVNDMNHLVQEIYDSPPGPSKQNLESQPRNGINNPSEKVPSLNTNTLFKDNKIEKQCLTEDVINSEVPSSFSRFVVIEDTSDIRPQEEEKNTIISCVSTINSIGRDIQYDSIDEVDDGASSFQCLKSYSIGRDDLFSSPTFCPRNVENPENKIDKMEGPSPISVLEPLLTENDISLMRALSQQDGTEIQQQQIHFGEQSSASDQICLITCMEAEESAYEYVEAVLLGSGLSWDDFLLRWLSLYEILDPSLFDEVKLFPGQSCHDKKPLFDCTNEVLEELCESYFGCFTGVSYTNLNIRPVPKRMDLIQEVWKQVECHLFQHFPPHSLDQFIEKDMAKSGKWMNIRVDIEHIGIEMEETIFDELVDDTILSFADYISGIDSPHIHLPRRSDIVWISYDRDDCRIRVFLVEVKK